MSQDFRELQASDNLSASRGYLNDTAEALETLFAGAAAPTSPTAYMLWADASTSTLKQRNGANDDWIIVGLLGQSFWGMLATTGGTMSGNLAMGDNKVTGLGLATAAQDAVRKQEHDLKANLAAPVLTGDATVDQDPAGNNSLTRRSWTEGRYLKLAGGTLTGHLILPGGSTNALGAVTKQDVETMTSFHVSTGHDHDGTDSKRVIATNLNSTGGAVGALLRAAAGGVMDFGPAMPFTQMRWGSVNASGTIVIAGSANWTCTYVGEGRRTINFTGSMPSAPIVLAHHLYDGSSTAIRTRVYIATAAAVDIWTLDSAGANKEGAFAFIAMC